MKKYFSDVLKMLSAIGVTNALWPLFKAIGTVLDLWKAKAYTGGEWLSQFGKAVAQNYKATFNLAELLPLVVFCVVVCAIIAGIYRIFEAD